MKLGAGLPQILSLGLVAILVGTGCSNSQVVNNGLATDNGGPDKPRRGINADYGVGVDTKTIDVGLIFVADAQKEQPSPDHRSCVLGRQLLNSGLPTKPGKYLPKGWSIRYISVPTDGSEADARLAYQQVKDRVLFVFSCLNPKQEAALRPSLPRDDLVLFTTNRDRAAHEHEFTPPTGAPVATETRRAVEWSAEAEGKTRLALVADEGLQGIETTQVGQATAAAVGMEVVLTQNTGSTDNQVAALVAALKKGKPSHVVLGGTVSQTERLITAATKSGLHPTWIALSSSWSERLEVPGALPEGALTAVHRITGWPVPGDGAPGYPAFAAYWAEIHGKEPLEAATAGSFAQGQIVLHALQRALQDQDVTRSGFRRSLAQERASRGGELLHPQDYSQVPYPGTPKLAVLQVVPGGDPQVVAAESEPRTSGRQDEVLDDAADEMRTQASEEGAAEQPKGTKGRGEEAPSGTNSGEQEEESENPKDDGQEPKAKGAEPKAKPTDDGPGAGPGG